MLMDYKKRCEDCACLIEKNGEHYDLAFASLHFVTLEDLEPEFAMVDKSGTFKETVMTMLGFI